MCLSICPSIHLSCMSVHLFHFLTITCWLVTKLGMNIDIEEIWFRITNWQISFIFDSYLPTNGGVLSFHVFFYFLLYLPQIPIQYICLKI